MLDFSQFPIYLLLSSWGTTAVVTKDMILTWNMLGKVRRDISVLVSVCTWMWSFQLLDTLRLSKSQVPLIKVCDVYFSSIVLNKLCQILQMEASTVHNNVSNSYKNDKKILPGWRLAKIWTRAIYSQTICKTFDQVHKYSKSYIVTMKIFFRIKKEHIWKIQEKHNTCEIFYQKTN